MFSPFSYWYQLERILSLPTNSILASGAVTLPSLVQNLDVPKQTNTVAHEWVAEGSGANDAAVTIGTVQLRPHTMAAAVPYTRRLMLQSLPNVELVVGTELLAGFSDGIDKYSVDGSGTGNEPLGITNQTGVNKVVITAANIPNLTWKEALQFKFEVLNDNARRGGEAYHINARVWHAGRSNAIEGGAIQRILGVAGGLNLDATPAFINTNFSSTELLYGHFNQLWLGFWGTFEIQVDTATLATSGGRVLRSFVDTDFAVRHAQSFCVQAIA